MSEATPGAALRELQHAQAAMKKARQALAFVRREADPESRSAAMRIGWDSLTRAHRILATIPLQAATEPVMTRQLAVQRYATALLVRLRRLARNDDFDADDHDSDEFDDD